MYVGVQGKMKFYVSPSTLCVVGDRLLRAIITASHPPDVLTLVKPHSHITTHTQKDDELSQQSTDMHNACINRYIMHN